MKPQPMVAFYQTKMQLDNSHTPKTLGYDVVKSAYGLWLLCKDRGSWSEALDDQIRFFEPRKLHAGDLIRPRILRNA